MAEPDDIRCSVTTENPELPATATVSRITGRTGLSSPYRFFVEIADDGVDPEQYVGADVRITLTDSLYERCFDGVATHVQCASLGTGDLVVLTIEPRLIILTQRENYKIFQNKTAREIVTEILDDASLYLDRRAWRLDTDTTLPSREYCVQYGETDLAFISRLLEEEGIFYYFEHPARWDPTGETLVFCSAAASCPTVEGETEIPFAENAGLQPGDRVFPFQLASAMVPNEYMVRDFNYENPALRGMECHTIQGETNNSLGERRIYQYPGGYEIQKEGEERSRQWLQARRARNPDAQGNCTSIRFEAGRRFNLTEHPRSQFNVEYFIWVASYVIRPAETGTDGDSHGQYLCRFEATPSSVPVRPPRVTPKPRVLGSQTALVVGSGKEDVAGDEEIHTDELGRIRVQFHWDRDGEDNADSSCYIRVAQSWAGAGWGGMIIPRIGMEVVVDFLEGNPDRPLVTGCVYNGTHPPPYPLPTNNTKSTFRTNSSPDGDGFNELTFEDKKGDEFIYMHAEKDHLEEILHDHKAKIDNNEQIEVKRAHSISAGTITHSAGGTHTEHAGTDHTRTADANITDHAGADHFDDAGGSQYRTAGGDVVDHADGDAFRGASNIHDDATSAHLTTAGSSIEGYAPAITWNGFATILLDTSVLVGSASAVATLSAPTAVITGSAVLSLTGGVVTMTGGPISVASTGPLGLAGATVNIVGGSVGVVGGSIAIAGGTISIVGGDVTMVGGTVGVNGGSVSVNGGSVAIGNGDVSISGSIKLNC